MPLDKAVLLEALEEARALGATSCDYQDRKIKYRSLTEMDQIIRGLKRDLGQIEGGIRRRVVATRKGLGGATGGQA